MNRIRTALRFLNTVFFLLVMLLVAMPASGKNDKKNIALNRMGLLANNGVQKQRTDAKGNPVASGIVFDQQTGLCIKDLEREHKKDIALLKKQLKAKNVTIVAAADDYWYYSIEAKGSHYGVANSKGKVVVQPQYKRCYYCPIVSEGIDEFTLSGEMLDAPMSFSLYHPQTRGSFLVNDGNSWKVFSLEGNNVASLPMGVPATYYHGYIIYGVKASDIEPVCPDKTVSIAAVNDNVTSTIGIMTSDGRRLSLPLQRALQIESMENGRQIVYNYQPDAAGVTRKGAWLLNNPQSSIPAIFGDIYYNDDDNSWWVCPNALQNIEPYDAARHTSPIYKDDGEKMFYRDDYEGCINFYKPLLDDRDSLGLLKSPWAAFYTAVSLYEMGKNHEREILSATIAFEDVSQRTYPLYYDRRHDMLTWPEGDMKGWQIAQDLFDDYTRSDMQQEFSNTAESIGENIAREFKIYENYSKRYDIALQTLDRRIAELKAADRRKAQQEAAERAALAANIVNNITNTMNSIFAPSPSTSSSKATAKAGSKKSSSGSSSSSSSEPKKKKCKTCNGTGKEPDVNYHSDKTKTKAWCDECGQEEFIPHKHKPCRTCHGDGVF